VGEPSDERAAVSAGPDTPRPLTPVVVTTAAPADTRPPAAASVDREEVARITVEPEDRLAFRVGVNILTLVLVGLAVYLVWRRYFAGG
jgi:hypothetical protein